MLRRLLLAMALVAMPAFAADWVLSVVEPRVKAGARFGFEVVGPADEKLPDVLALQVRGDRRVPLLAAEALAPQQGVRRRYAAQLPRLPAGAAQLELADRASGVLVLEPFERERAQAAAGKMRQALVARGRWRADVRAEESYDPSTARVALRFVVSVWERQRRRHREIRRRGKARAGRGARGSRTCSGN